MRPTKMVINLDALRNNIRYIKSKANKDIVGIVKANAYGCGSYEVAKVLIEEGAVLLAVAYIEEAIELRDKGINHPILVMGSSYPDDVSLANQYDLTLGIYSLQYLKTITVDKPTKFHLKLDTGMNRLGLKRDEDINEALAIINENPNIVLEGVYTHYATSDCIESEYIKQMKRFDEIISKYKLTTLKYIHTSNSAASLKYKEQFTNAIRPGIALYGLKPSDDKYDLENVISLYSAIMNIKQLKQGESVSYGYTYTANEDQLIGLIPIGYADGWIRAHQGRTVMINNKCYPIIGRICMDQMLVKIDESVKLYDQVELFGNLITIDEIAKQFNTINYEIICMIGKRVRREYVDVKVI